MNIKTGDYIENLRGIVGVVNTVGRPAENENGKRLACCVGRRFASHALRAY